jgi:hypothetical protein
VGVQAEAELQTNVWVGKIKEKSTKNHKCVAAVKA